MKNSKLFFAFAILVGCLFGSCSTDFEINAPWQEETIVYGLLDASQEYQYVRVNKAFLGEDVSALDIAQDSDSLYHIQDITVILKEYNQYEEVERTRLFERVDASEDNIYKEEGVFSSSPYFLYRTEIDMLKLVGGDLELREPEGFYELVVTLDEGRFAAARTPVIGDVEFSNLTEETMLNWINNYKVRFRPPTNGYTYDLVVDINYREDRFVDGVEVSENKFVEWSVFSNLLGEDNLFSSRVEYTIEPEAFFNFLDGALTVDDDLIIREIISVDFNLYCGTEDLKKFNDVTYAQQGITSSQVQPEWTNVEQGTGLFSSRYTERVEGVEFVPATINEIACGEITGYLKFANDPSSLTYPYCN